MMLGEVMFFFFFQAEDGIRDKLVTGVQTCALPICSLSFPSDSRPSSRQPHVDPGARESDGKESERREADGDDDRGHGGRAISRSGERRVGEEGRSRWAPHHYKKKKRIIVRERVAM